MREWKVFLTLFMHLRCRIRHRTTSLSSDFGDLRCSWVEMEGLSSVPSTLSSVFLEFNVSDSVKDGSFSDIFKAFLLSLGCACWRLQCFFFEASPVMRSLMREREIWLCFFFNKKNRRKEGEGGLWDLVVLVGWWFFYKAEAPVVFLCNCGCWGHI